MRRLFVFAATVLFAVPIAFASSTPAPKNAKVYFISPQDGATVSGPVKVVFGLSGMGVSPAGIEKPSTGHHHLLVNTELKNMKMPIPKDDRHRHFGGGQTETELRLPPGRHTLQLVVGDWSHIPHNPPITSEKITITVK
jgi:hypothetical protein